jgi:large subunit ribosomal protein L28
MAINISLKKPLSGNRRSHSNRATKHMQKPNLQKLTVDGTSVRLSAREIRTLKKASKIDKIESTEE